MKVLLLNQCFWPDVVATAQQLTDLGVALHERGHQVTVIAGDRGYDNSALRFPRRERWNGITIRRISAISAGKQTRWQRALNFGSFIGACAWRLALMPRQDVVVALTSPPLISWLASIFTRLKGGRLIFWVMDLNPDEAIAAGWLKRDSLTSKTLAKLLHSSMNRSDRIVALDRFAKQRIVEKGIGEDKIEIISPWSHDNAVQFDQEGRKSFRAANGLSGKYVVMYAGNHSPCHPLDTLLAAALRMKERDDVMFCFVGGGSEQSRVRAFAETNELRNILCLPYQPLSKLSAALSAADLHVVVMGDAFVGIVHPSKVYNILAIGSPFVYIGPAISHVTDIIAQLADPGAAKAARHGDVDSLTKHIKEGADAGGRTKRRQRSELADTFAKDVLLPRLLEVVESRDAAPEVLGATVPAAKVQSA